MLLSGDDNCWPYLIIKMGIEDHSLLLEVRIPMIRTITRKTTVYASAVSMIAAMAIIPAMARPAMADEVCSPETVPDTSGKADYTYKLDTDCTLHIGPTNIPSKSVNLDIVHSIQQHDKVRKIVFEKPEQTSLNENSSYLFSDYPKVESIEGIDKLDVSHVTDFNYAFAGLHLKKPADLSSWDIRKAYHFQAMFLGSNLDGFNGIDNFSFDLEDKPYQQNAKDFRSMFKGTTSDKGIDLSGWKFLNPNESAGLLFDSMFDGARTPRIDVSSFSDLDLNAETNMNASGMFANTNADIEGLDRFSAQSMADADGMFKNAKPTNQIDLSSWDTSKWISAREMFKGSDIDKFSGMDKWNLESFFNSIRMYADLHPSHPVRIQANLPNLSAGQEMFADSDLDMFPDIDRLQLSANPYTHNTSFDGIFKDSTATYLKMSDWKKGRYQIIQAEGMLASPNIKYTTFGNKTVDKRDVPSDFGVYDSSSLFKWNPDTGTSDSINVWDRQDLPKEYSAKKWAVLPIKPECDAQFNGDPDKLPKDCWDDGQSWVSDKTGKEADEELLDNTTKHYQRIFFRVESVPVSFNANGVESAQDMPGMTHFLKTFTSEDDLIPDTTPKDPTGVKVFGSWNTQADGRGKTYHPGDHLGHDINSIGLYAQWRDKAPKVQFDNNGGEGPTPETKPTDDDTKIAVDCTKTPSKDEATFIGWSRTRNDVLEGHDAGEKGKIAVCGYSNRKTVSGLEGRTIDLYATWARNPRAVFNENRPKDMTALLPATKTITSKWTIDDSEPKTYVAPNIDGWYKGYTPDGVWQFDGWVNEDGSPFTGTYLDRDDVTINAKWTRMANGTSGNGDTDDGSDTGNGSGNAGQTNGSTSDHSGSSGNTANQNGSSQPSSSQGTTGSSSVTDVQQHEDSNPGTSSNAGSRNEDGGAAAGTADNGETTVGSIPLARTGASVFGSIVVGVVLMVIGFGVVMTARRHHHG